MFTGVVGQSQQQTSAGGGGLFSSIKGYSGSIFKNIKDTSSKVMQTVSQYVYFLPILVLV